MNFNFCPSCGTEGSVKKQDATNYECEKCSWHHWNNAKAATSIAFIKDGKLLVVQRAHEPNKGLHELAGGFVDFGESAYEGAIREAREELGITLTPADLELTALYMNNYDSDVSTVDIVFTVRTWRGEFRPADDVAAISWEPLSFIYDPTFYQMYDGLDKKILALLEKQ